MIRSLYGRADRLCCTVKDRDTEKEHIESALISNGYPRHIISKYNAPSRRREGEERENPKASIVILYVRNLSESIRRILTRYNIRTCFKPNTTLRNLLVHPKDRIPSTSKRGVVYQIPCRDCSEVYIGQTGRTLEHRIKEHRRAYSSADSINSAVAEHSLNHEHAIDWNNSEVVAMQQGVHKRCIIESWTIRNSTSTMNRDKGLLPDVYNSLIALGQASS